MLTWRGIADQLTPRQIDLIEKIEAELLEHARNSAELNLVEHADSDMPVPSGARAHPWEKLTKGGYARSLEWHTSETADGDTAVDINGYQQDDGSFTCQISLYTNAWGVATLTSAQARELAAMLLNTADEFDTLSQPKVVV